MEMGQYTKMMGRLFNGKHNLRVRGRKINLELEPGLGGRTAKSCGPDAPTLASSLRSRVGPTGLRQNISAGDGGKRARSPGRARRKPLKPLRAGTSGDSGVLVVTRVRSTTTKCTLGRGCSGHPAFPTPSLGGRFSKASGASRRGIYTHA